MGANKNSGQEKCGEILINIKTIRNKAKIFTFQCALCGINCDQLKKFSKHLEKHLHNFDNSLVNNDGQVKDSILLFEPEEIKVEQQIDAELINKNNINAVSSKTVLEEYKDPLDTEIPQKCELESNAEEFNSKDIKDENGIEVKSCASSSSEMVFDSNQNIYEPTKYIKNNFTPKDFNFDDLTDYSSDAEFDINKELKTHKNTKISKNIMKNIKIDVAKRRKKLLNDKNGNDVNTKSKRRRRVIIEAILPILIQRYKTHNMLWQVDDLGFGVKNKKYEIYSKIAEELKLEVNENISLEDINYHINYLNELYSKDKESELKCKKEGKLFLPEYEYYAEMSFLSDSQGPFLCMICNEILPKYASYCQHMAQHNGTQPFKCPACQMMFTNYHKYLIHKKRHLGVYNFYCAICGKGYLFKNDLEWHITSHTGDKPYLCQICGTGFRARHGYDNHIRRHEERYRHECHICKRGFNQLHALNNHVKSHLNIRDVICNICGKGFVHTKYLKRHELIHGKEKHYKCTECGKEFFQACGLRAHRKNHHS